MRSGEFHQLLRKLPVEFLGSSRERKWRGYGGIFCFLGSLRNDSRAYSVAVDERKRQQESAFAQQWH